MQLIQKIQANRATCMEDATFVEKKIVETKDNRHKTY